MEKKLTWDEIKKHYNNEWVELIDFDWPEESLYPSSAIVRVHAPDRAEFYKLASENPARDSAFLFVGEYGRPKGTYLSSNLRRVVTHHA